MRWTRSPILAAALVLALAGAARALASQETPPEAAAYAGGETCAGCHDTVASHLATTPHGGPDFARRSARACETCHGPAAAHAEDPDNVALRPRMDRLTAREVSATCQGCHKGGKQLLWQGSRHAMRGLTCTNCHGVHTFKSDASQLKAETAMDQCFTCHKDIRADTWKNSHHPIREGKIACFDCHEPHGSQTPKLIKAVSINEQCYSCHTEKRGPFLWEHAPVREACTTCHTPHGSNHLKLQKTSVPYLCQQCHSNTRHPGTLYDGLRVPSLENEPPNPFASNRLFNRACLDCHAQIHGSNHPSAPYLGH